MNSKVVFDELFDRITESDELFDRVAESALEQAARRAIAGGMDRGQVLEVVYRAIEPTQAQEQ